MNIVRKALGAATEALADARQVLVTCSTAAIDRVGDIVEQAGIDVSNFARLKTVLWNHDQNRPIAKAVTVSIVGDHLEALVEFPPEGVSKLADETYGLIKAGVINAVSIGFLPTEGKALDGKDPKKGMRITKCELLELSFVSVPANPNAEIMERAMPAETKAVPRLAVKGLYDLGNLVYALQLLGYSAQNAAWEAGYEGDGSEVPEQLAQACRDVGAILVAMTAEEVGEFLACVAPTGEATEKRLPHLVVKAALAARATPPTTEKAGRMLSTKNASALAEACKAILAGHDTIKALVDEASADDGTGDDGADGDDDAAGTKAAPPPAAKNLEQDRRRRRARALAAAA